MSLVSQVLLGFYISSPANDLSNQIQEKQLRHEYELLSLFVWMRCEKGAMITPATERKVFPVLGHSRSHVLGICPSCILLCVH